MTAKLLPETETRKELFESLPESGLTLNEYQRISGETAVYPGRGELLGLLYCTLGQSGEGGEFTNKLKKVLRGDVVLADVREQLADEAGDELWYLARKAKELGFTLEEIAQRNIEKLRSRMERGTIKAMQCDRCEDGYGRILPSFRADIEARVESGRQKYGERLTSHNGRNAMLDLYQELLDATLYARQAIHEKENP